jgi:hypothetical protein
MIDIVARQARLVCVFTLGRKGVNNCEDLEHGAFHQFLNAGKKSITLDLELPNNSGLSTSFRRQPIS